MVKSGKQLTKGPILSKYIRAYDHIPRMTEEELEYFGQEKERIRAMFEEMTDQELDPTQVRNHKYFSKMCKFSHWGSTLDLYWQILRNSSKYFSKIRVVTRTDFWKTFQFPVHTLLIMGNFRNNSSESTLGSFKGVASRRIY